MNIRELSNRKEKYQVVHYIGILNLVKLKGLIQQEFLEVITHLDDLSHQQMIKLVLIHTLIRLNKNKIKERLIVIAKKINA